MTYNILAYSIFATITVYIIYWVGKAFHSNGRVFILQLFRQNEPMTDTTNNILLVTYYLFNIGYAILQLSFWESVTDAATLVSSIAAKMGLLIIILAITHYFNLTLIYLLSKKQKKTVQNL